MKNKALIFFTVVKWAIIVASLATLNAMCDLFGCHTSSNRFMFSSPVLKFFIQFHSSFEGFKNFLFLLELRYLCLDFICLCMQRDHFVFNYLPLLQILYSLVQTSCTAFIQVFGNKFLDTFLAHFPELFVQVSIHPIGLAESCRIIEAVHWRLLNSSNIFEAWTNC